MRKAPARSLQSDTFEAFDEPCQR